MKRLTDQRTAHDFVFGCRADGESVGIVPTMGALHDGHLSLVRLSREQCDQTIATIFVNPTQFGPGEDLDQYPRTLQQDCEMLASEGAAAVFIPTNQMMYPDGYSTFVQPPDIAGPLEGERRPGHFRGVATVVLKLFQLLPATHAFFGRKDYQQLKVIQAMTRDLNVGIEVIAGDIIREPDGLALSSRNRYLDQDERKRALSLSKALDLATQFIADGEVNVSKIETNMHSILNAENGVDKIDYAVIVDQETLLPIDTVQQNAVALIAAYVGKTRLIDNVLL